MCFCVWNTLRLLCLRSDSISITPLMCFLFSIIFHQAAGLLVCLYAKVANSSLLGSQIYGTCRKQKITFLFVFNLAVNTDLFGVVEPLQPRPFIHQFDLTVALQPASCGGRVHRVCVKSFSPQLLKKKKKTQMQSHCKYECSARSFT